MTETAKQKVENQKNGIAYGCHIDLDHGHEPDGCVKDYGVDGDCIYARHHKTREACKYWLKIKGKE